MDEVNNLKLKLRSLEMELHKTKQHANFLTKEVEGLRSQNQDLEKALAGMNRKPLSVLNAELPGASL